MAHLISIVTPAFNEEKTLPQFFQRLRAITPFLADRDLVAEMVIIDDHSTDGTRSVVRAAMADNHNVKYIRLARNSGSHAAIAAGLAHGTGDCAVIMAADLQDPPEIIPKLIDQWKLGNDVVWACRGVRHAESFVTKAMARVFYRLLRTLALPEMPENGADFLLLDRKVIDAFNTVSEKHTNCIALILWMGFRQTSIEYDKQARHEGKSKWTLAKKIKLLIDSVVSFSYVPIRAMSLLGSLMAAAGFLYALIVVIGRLTGTVVAGSGFAALMTVILIGQGSILVMLGVLGEYLWRTFDEARGRPRYLIEETCSSSEMLAQSSLREFSS